MIRRTFLSQRPRMRNLGSLAAAAVLAIAVVLVGVVPAAAIPPRNPDATWQTNGRVSAIIRVGGLVYLGGSFTEVRSPDGATVLPRGYLAAFDAATGVPDPTWAPSANGAVLALAASADGQRIYAGGSFSTIGGEPRKRTAALHATTGAVVSGWKANTNGQVQALAVAGSTVYIGGTFTTVQDKAGSHSITRLAALDATSGAVNTRWNPAPNDRVRALRTQTLSGGGTQLVVGGDFTAIAATSRRQLVAFDPSGDLVFAFRPTPQGGVYGLSVDGNSVYAAVGGAGGKCAAFTADNGSTLWSIAANGNVQAVTHLNGAVYCGGHFGGDGSFGGQARYKLASVQASTGAVTSFTPRVNSALGVWALAASSASSHLYVGGDFTQISGVSQQGLARFTDQ
jgi:hypothetical protein